MEPRFPEYETGAPRGHSVHSAAIPDSFLIMATLNRSEFLTPPSSATYLDEYPDIRDP